LIGFYVFLLMQGGQYPEAVRYAEHGARVAPGFADTQRLLGLAYYNADKLREAISAWQRAQQIQPNDAVQRYLAKAEREIVAEDSFSESQSPHFILRYPGRQAGFTLGSDLLRTLERQYIELSRELAFSPQSNITVLLYTEKEFFDVTQAPAWAGGVNDGKLRIPVGDVSGITPKLEQVLKHELTHSFVHYLTRGRCPHWLDEGIAQMMEPKSAATYGRVLAHLFETGKQAPLSELEGSFFAFPKDRAVVAYAESLAAAEYLRSNYGMSGLRRMLQLISDGESGESALRVTTRSNYREFEKSLAEHLAKAGTRD
jgi:tetratricopeptide (TPR) repeat protein